MKNVLVVFRFGNVKCVRVIVISRGRTLYGGAAEILNR